MDSEDPFFSPAQDDRTIIRPVPGGKQADIQPPPTVCAEVSARGGKLLHLGHLNPLENAASGLLALLTRLNSLRSHSNPDQLKDQITQELQRFQQAAQSQGVDEQTVRMADYILCTVLDEAVLNTPWGHSSGWAQHSLLANLHQEVSGGERFFSMLKKLAQNVPKNQHLLELMYLCLSLGFEGRYRVADNGRDKVVRIKEWLYQTLQPRRGTPEPELSPHWQGVTDRRNPLMRLVPLWVFGLAALGLLAALFTGFLFHLNGVSDPVFQQVYAIKAPVVDSGISPIVEPNPPPIIRTKPKLTLSILLAEEIRDNQVKVDETARQSQVTIQSDNLFASASATLSPSITPLLHRIGESLDQLPGQIQVNGHTDNRPISSVRYPSNWHLSQDRAEAVATLIKQNLGEVSRVVVEGRSDMEPVAENKTPQGRAQNRRVDILLIN